MQITKTLYVTDRKEWRRWLAKNHDKEKEIWLIFYKKDSGKPSIPYNDAVEEALCYGWIDSIVKKIDEEGRAQRFSPRKEKSNLSETNRERVNRLIKAGLMTKFGLVKIKNQLTVKFEIPADILKELKKDKIVWKNFQAFSNAYKNIRIGFIEDARSRPEEFKKRLKYFIKMTARNRQFGMVR